MAIFHCQFSIVSRSQGKSSVGASAYRAGEKIYNERDGIEHDYTNKTGVVYKEILTPDNAPEWAKDRAKLWNEVEKIEKSKNSQLAREVNIALPKELNREQQIELLKGYVKDNFTSKGMVADMAIHDKADGNPHAHVMLTVRPFEQDGTWGAKAKKEYILDQNGEKIKQGKDFKSRKIETTDWNKKENIENWREQWANHANKALEKANIKDRLDHRSYQEQGIEKVATIHEGYKVRAMEKRGVPTDIGNYNRQVAEKNKMLELVERQINIYEKQKGELEHGRFESNGVTDRAIGGKGHSSDIGTELLIGNKPRAIEVHSSRDYKSFTVIEGHNEPSQTGQRGIDKENSRDFQGQERLDNSIKPTDERLQTGSRGSEEHKLSENRRDEQETQRGTKGESGISQEDVKGHNGIGVPSEEHTQPIMEGKGEAIFNSASGHSGVDRGISGNIPTGNPFAEAFKALGSAIQKAEQKEQALAQKEKAKLEKQMNKQPTKSKSRGWDREL